jgi:hypothetical protein
MRFRQGGFIRLPSDEPEDIPGFRSSRNRLYDIRIIMATLTNSEKKVNRLYAI